MTAINYVIRMIIIVFLPFNRYFFVLYALRNDYLLEALRILKNKVGKKSDERL